MEGEEEKGDEEGVINEEGRKKEIEEEDHGGIK